MNSNHFLIPVTTLIDDLKNLFIDWLIHSLSIHDATPMLHTFLESRGKKKAQVMQSGPSWVSEPLMWLHLDVPLFKSTHCFLIK